MNLPDLNRAATLAAGLAAREKTKPTAQRVAELVALAHEALRLTEALLNDAELRRHGVPDA